MPQLMVIDGPQAGASFPLTGADNYVGKDNGQIQLSSSRGLACKQLRIRYAHDHYEVQRVGHVRQLLVNGIMVETARLNHGDIVTLDEVALVFVLESAPRVAPKRRPSGTAPFITFKGSPASSAILDAVPDVVEPGPGLSETQIRHRRRVSEDPQAVLKQLEDETDSNRRLATLFKVSSAISAILDLDELLGTILELIFENLPAERGSVLLFDKQSRKLRTMASKGRKGSKLEQVRPVISKTIVKEVLKTKDAVLTTDAMSDERFDLGMSIIQKNIRSAICVPLVRQDRLLGIIFIDNSERTQAFTAQDLDLMTGIAMQASLAIDNARLYQEVGEKERLKFEVDLASSIQKRLLPKRLPRSRELEVFGKMIPAKEVGGDYFDFQIDQRKAILFVLIGDVSGKGLPAGIVMAMARSYFRPLTLFESSPRSILKEVNRFLFEDTNRELFMSTLLMCWHERERKFVYTGAGHEHLIIYHASSRRAETIRSGGVALGLVEDAAQYFKESELVLESGDAVVLYTDGVTEAKDPDGRLFSLERLVEVTEKYGHLAARELLEAILWELKNYMAGAPQHDDITLVTIKKR